MAYSLEEYYIGRNAKYIKTQMVVKIIHLRLQNNRFRRLKWVKVVLIEADAKANNNTR